MFFEIYTFLSLGLYSSLMLSKILNNNIIEITYELQLSKNMKIIMLNAHTSAIILLFKWTGIIDISETIFGKPEGNGENLRYRQIQTKTDGNYNIGSNH